MQSSLDYKIKIIVTRNLNKNRLVCVLGICVFICVHVSSISSFGVYTYIVLVCANLDIFFIFFFKLRICWIFACMIGVFMCMYGYLRVYLGHVCVCGSFRRIVAAEFTLAVD